MKRSVLLTVALAATACNPEQKEVTAPSDRPRLDAVAAGERNRIAFVSFRDGGRTRIFVMNEDGSGPTNLMPISTSFGESSPAVSPDGTQIAFTRPDAHNNFENIHVMNADGSNVRNLTPGQEGAGTATWSPDGLKIAYVLQGNIYVINADGSNLIALTATEFGANTMPAWSPDGSRIAFVSTRDGPWAIYSMAVDGSDLRSVTTPTSGVDEYSPAWSPDGQRLVFVRGALGYFELYLVNADGSGEVQLTADGAANFEPDWSPDGTKIVFDGNRVGSSREHIYTINADGTDERQLTSDATSDRDPSWGVVAADEPEPPGSTPVGPGVVVAPVDAATTSSPVSLTFAQVTAAGTTTLTTSSQGTAPPQDFQLGSPPVYYELQTTATFTGLITICINYSGTTFAGTRNLRLFHGGAGGTWMDVTTTTNPATNTICGSVSSLSPFIVAQFQYAFEGFFQPLDNPGSTTPYLVNRMKAGSAVPVKFSLGSNQGLNIFAPGNPGSKATACGTLTNVDLIEQTSTAGSSSLSYDPVSKQYSYVWKTDKGWAGTCRQLVVGLIDGTTHTALFNFTK
jgi:Tol biopolymer transport system component